MLESHVEGKTYYTVKDIGGRPEQQGKAGDILKRIDK